MSHQLWERIPYTLINVSNDAAALLSTAAMMKWQRRRSTYHHHLRERVRLGPSKHNMLWNMEFMWNLLRHIMMSEWEIENWESSRNEKKGEGEENRAPKSNHVRCNKLQAVTERQFTVRFFTLFSPNGSLWLSEEREEIPPLLVIVSR